MIISLIHPVPQPPLERNIVESPIGVPGSESSCKMHKDT